MKTSEIKALLEEMLETGKIQVVIDTNRRGVKVPPQFLNVGPTVFILAWEYPGIDLKITPRTAKATLKFGENPFDAHFLSNLSRALFQWIIPPSSLTLSPLKRKPRSSRPPGCSRKRTNCPRQVSDTADL